MEYVNYINYSQNYVTALKIKYWNFVIKFYITGSQLYHWCLRAIHQKPMILSMPACDC